MSRSPDSGSCGGVHSDLERYLDGALSTARIHQVETHLAGCPNCLAQMHLAREIQNELRGLPEIDTPAATIHSIFEQTVRRETANPRTTKASSHWWRPAWIALATAALALAVGLSLWTRSEPPAPAAEAEAIARATTEARFALEQVGLATHKAAMALENEALRDGIIKPTQRGLSRVITHDPAGSSTTLREGVDHV